MMSLFGPSTPWLLSLGLCLLLHAACRAQPASEAGAIQQRAFGTMPDGRVIDAFTLTNANGVEVEIITYGGNIRVLRVPDRRGQLGDVVLGFDALDGYLEQYSRFGATIGRYGNRIADGRFTLDGTTYQLAVNNGDNHLHGGVRGFDKRVWDAEVAAEDGRQKLRLHYLSPDGEWGYPGNLDVTVDYTLTDEDELVIDYRATTDRATPVNLTNHAWFDLSAGSSDNTLGHVVQIHATRYTALDDEQIPTGDIAPVAGTPLDFTTAKPIGRDLEAACGYDHNYVLDRDAAGTLFQAAEARDPATGRTLAVYTTEPGLQFYTGNGLDGSITGKGGRVYEKYEGFCLEAQHFPDAPNHSGFPSTILRPGETYRQTTIYAFGTDE
jgi:aldose 1-epimerase